MREELDKALVNDFPLLYRDRYGDMRSTSMCWGFDCGDGWEPLIRRLSEKLEPIIKDKDLECRASQVKEKYGTLRFYMTSATDEMWAYIDEACRESKTTCEECGVKGELRPNLSWIRTLCDFCYRKTGYEAIADLAHKGQYYGEFPYTTHLEAVHRLCRLYTSDPDTIVAAYLHDILEDTTETPESLLTDGITPRAIEIIKLVTDEPGANRKEKKAKTYEKLKNCNDFEAIIVKLCDRIINVQFCFITNPRLTYMYEKEKDHFDDMLAPYLSDLRVQKLKHILDISYHSQK